MPTATETFADELTRAAKLDMRANPFVAAVIEGRCSRDVIRRYGVLVFELAEGFPQRLAAAAAICDDPAARIALLQNLLEEEGVVEYSGGRLVADETRRHSNAARRFAIAAGASEGDLRDAATSKGGEGMWLGTAMAQRRAAAVIAYLTVGIESNVPHTLSMISTALSRHYGFAEHDLEFLTSHVALDTSHGAAGARLVERLARNDADRTDALEGARRGALAWWWLHRSLLSNR